MSEPENVRHGLTDREMLTERWRSDANPSVSPTPAATVIGSPSIVLGNYVLLEQIGEGGMGQVFRAWHRHMDREVALKVLSQRLLQDEQAVLRFQREAKAAARLIHPQIVMAYDAGRDGATQYLVSEYIDGLDLKSLVQRRGPLPVGEAVHFILQAARGLAYAHEKEVIHRDVKPSNLLVARDGTLKVLDLGLARLREDGGSAAQRSLTATGVMFGTVDYMAPEQARDSRQADARSDIYSLGCTLHYLLTGNPPFGGDTLINRVLAHANDPIPSLRATRDDVPSDLEAVHARMLAKIPAGRYQAMAQVISALEELRLEGTADLDALSQALPPTRPPGSAAPADNATPLERAAKSSRTPRIAERSGQPVAGADRLQETDVSSVPHDTTRDRRLGGRLDRPWAVFRGAVWRSHWGPRRRWLLLLLVAVGAAIAAPKFFSQPTPQPIAGPQKMLAPPTEDANLTTLQQPRTAPPDAPVANPPQPIERAEPELAWKPAPAAGPGRRVALLVGIDEYPQASGLNSISFAENDVEALGKLLEEDLGYHTVHMMTLSRSQDGISNLRFLPTRSNIERELDVIFNNLTVEDQILVAFSGQGVQLKGKDYLCPIDTNLLGDRAEETLLPMQIVLEKMDQCPAGLKLLFCDACRNDIENASARTRGMKVQGLDPNTVPSPRNESSNFLRMFSCQPGQQSYEDAKLQHSLFFHFVLKGLGGDKGAAVDGRVTVVSLSEYVQTNVSDYASRELAARQVPHIASEIRNRNYRVIREMNWLPEGYESLYEPWDEEFEVEVLGNLRLYKSIKKPLLSADGKPLLDRAGEPLEVAFHLVKTRPGEPAPFYMMENKVWRDLFLTFGREHPEALDEESPWRALIENDKSLPADGRLPAFDVSPHEALRFARWLGGRLPSAAEWDKASGLHDEHRPSSGPYRDPPGDASPQVAVNLQRPVPVGTSRDDVSSYSIRDMAGNGSEFTGTVRSTPAVGVVRQFQENMWLGSKPRGEPGQVEHRALELRSQKHTAKAPLNYDMIENGLINMENDRRPDCGFRVVLEIEL